jgi:hypothetical protein
LSAEVKWVTAAGNRPQMGRRRWKGLHTEWESTFGYFWRTEWSFHETGADRMRPTSSRDPSAQSKHLHFGQLARGCLPMVGFRDWQTRRWSKQTQFATCWIPHEFNWPGI